MKYTATLIMLMKERKQIQGNTDYATSFIKV